MADEKKSTTSARFSAGRGAIALLATLAIAFCAWSMSQYVRGNDPLAWLGSGGAGEQATELAGKQNAEDAGAAPADESSSTPARLDLADVTAALSDFAWDGNDVALQADDVQVVLDEGGIWVEHRGADPAPEMLERTCARLGALASWAGSQEVAVPQVSWIEEDLTGAVRLAASVEPRSVSDGMKAADVLAACRGYALSGDAFAGLGESLGIAQKAGTTLTLPSGEAISVVAGASERGEVLDERLLEDTVMRQEGEEAEPSNDPAASGGNATAASNGTDGQSAQAAPAQITVSVTVDASSKGAGTLSANVSLAPGSTALDALRATASSVQTRPYGGGSWVTSVSGVSEDSSHGWTYYVDGSMPSAMSDRVEVHDGSTVRWVLAELS